MDKVELVTLGLGSPVFRVGDKPFLFILYNT